MAAIRAVCGHHLFEVVIGVDRVGPAVCGLTLNGLCARASAGDRQSTLLVATDGENVATRCPSWVESPVPVRSAGSGELRRMGLVQAALCSGRSLAGWLGRARGATSDGLELMLR